MTRLSSVIYVSPGSTRLVTKSLTGNTNITKKMKMKNLSAKNVKNVNFVTKLLLRITLFLNATTVIEESIISATNMIKKILILGKKTTMKNFLLALIALRIYFLSLTSMTNRFN